MKKQIKKFTAFSKNIGQGLNVEFKETIEIPSLIRRREFRKAGNQVIDLFKMTGLTIVWIVPGGAVITAMILKLSYKSRPSAFQIKESDGSSSIENEKNLDKKSGDE